MNALKRLVLISGVLISEERSLDWESGPGSDAATVLMGKMSHKYHLFSSQFFH